LITTILPRVEPLFFRTEPAILVGDFRNLSSATTISSRSEEKAIKTVIEQAEVLYGNGWHNIIQITKVEKPLNI
jgi:hypothetical protein